jgi:hypothetical protein
MRADRIIMHEDWQPEPYLNFVRDQVGAVHRWPADKQLPDTALVAGVVVAYVNHGRWVVECPTGDGGALCVSRNYLLFLCPFCLNEVNGGQWYEVRLPANKPNLEVRLLKRPATDGFNATTRNWRPGETEADLRAENVRMGVES